MTILAGSAISLQSYLNGRLGKEIGSATVAASINNLVALVATLAIVLATRAVPRGVARLRALGRPPAWHFLGGFGGAAIVLVSAAADRKSTRLNSSHVAISYAVFCLKKKKT